MCCVVCVYPFGSCFKHRECQGLQFVCWGHSYPGAAPSKLGGDFCGEKHLTITAGRWTASVCDLSCISANMQSLMTKQEDHFSLRGIQLFHSKPTKIHLRLFCFSKWKALNCYATSASKIDYLWFLWRFCCKFPAYQVMGTHAARASRLTATRLDEVSSGCSQLICSRQVRAD